MSIKSKYCDGQFGMAIWLVLIVTFAIYTFRALRLQFSLPVPVCFNSHPPSLAHHAIPPLVWWGDQFIDLLVLFHQFGERTSLFTILFHSFGVEPVYLFILFHQFCEGTSLSTYLSCSTSWWDDQFIYLSCSTNLVRGPVYLLTYLVPPAWRESVGWWVRYRHPISEIKKTIHSVMDQNPIFQQITNTLHQAKLVTFWNFVLVFTEIGSTAHKSFLGWWEQGSK